MSEIEQFIERIKNHPITYLDCRSITFFDAFMCGYRHAQREFKISLTEAQKELQNFDKWLRKRYPAAPDRNWQKLILFYSEDERKALYNFFTLYEEYCQRDQSLDIPEKDANPQANGINLHLLMQQIKVNTSNYLYRPSISNLRALLSGYRYARREFKISATKKELELVDFWRWLSRKNLTTSNSSWVKLLTFYSKDKTEALYKFFELYEKYYQEHQNLVVAENYNHNLPQIKRESLKQFLQKIKKHPTLYLGRLSISHLGAFLKGCSKFEMDFKIRNTEKQLELIDFHKWVRERYPTAPSKNKSLAKRLMCCYEDETEAFYKFFELYEEYHKQYLASGKNYSQEEDRICTLNEFMAKIKNRQTYSGSRSITHLKVFWHGYQYILREFHIPTTKKESDFSYFVKWIREKYAINEDISWSKVMLFYSENERQAFDHFLELYEEYQTQSNNSKIYRNIN